MTTTTKPKLKDFVFRQGAGNVVVDGRSNWPALVRVNVARENALQLAIQLISAVRDADRGDPVYIELPMFGTLEEMPAE
ncbi:hypothetical protein HFO56_02835 [Rhizobium laguerreae]|uniref:hypothetical protein n=1 Tax=Rhizobium laguerreae TaxID=1076926 RepID=UPI001C9107F7|nr:hypothetical protein [Rhizobium laguerreae]MBY3151322.1 hypothetical protein [Rhizobium laguerreae]MBY3433517.1 hypothetical protein [Rhizobium laguerreae]